MPLDSGFLGQFSPRLLYKHNGLSTYGKPRVISCSESFPDYIGLPRGCLEEVVDFQKNGVKTEIQDKRNPGQKIAVFFSTELRVEQHDAVKQAAIFGLLPILPLRMHGKEIERPLAIVMTGGLVTSTLFILLVLPTIYPLFTKRELK